MEHNTKGPDYLLPIISGVLGITNLIDWIMTDYAMKTGAQELNPIARWFIEHDLFNELKFGSTMLLVFSSGFTGWAESKDYFKDFMWVYNILVGMIAVVVIGYVIVIINNIMQFTAFKGVGVTGN